MHITEEAPNEGWSCLSTEVIDGVTVDLWTNRDGQHLVVQAHPAPWHWDEVTDTGMAIAARLARSEGHEANMGLLGYWTLPADPSLRLQEAKREGELRLQERMDVDVDWPTEWCGGRPMDPRRTDRE